MENKDPNSQLSTFEKAMKKEELKYNFEKARKRFDLEEAFFLVKGIMKKCFNGETDVIDLCVYRGSICGSIESDTFEGMSDEDRVNAFFGLLIGYCDMFEYANAVKHINFIKLRTTKEEKYTLVTVKRSMNSNRQLGDSLV